MICRFSNPATIQYDASGTHTIIAGAAIEFHTNNSNEAESAGGIGTKFPSPPLS